MQKKSMSNSLANPLIDSAKKHVPLSHSFSDQLSDHVSIDSDDPLLANSHADSVVHFNECLQGLNMYMDSRAGDKQQVVVMLEIPAVGNTTYRTMSLRQLLSYIDEEIAKFELNKSLNKGDAPEPMQGYVKIS